MRVRLVVLLFASILLACRGAKAPTAEENAGSSRNGEHRAGSPHWVAWTHGQEGDTTLFLRDDGEVTERLPGAHVATSRGVYRWVTSRVDVPTQPCEYEGAARTHGEGIMTRAAFSRDGESVTVVEPDTHVGVVNEIRHDVSLLASLGPYAFVHETTAVYACGAHGETNASFFVWDLESRKRVDLLASLPDREQILARARPKILADQKEYGVFGDEPPEITELVPLLSGTEVVFEAQVTFASCYACGDGRWSSYTRSVRVTTAPPPMLSSYSVLPPALALLVSGGARIAGFGPLASPNMQK